MNHRERWNLSRRMLTACKRAVKEGKTVAPPNKINFMERWCPLGVVSNIVDSRTPMHRSETTTRLGLSTAEAASFITGFDCGVNSYTTKIYKNDPMFRLGNKFRKLALEGGFK